jgi:hypothetical protein
LIGRIVDWNNLGKEGRLVDWNMVGIEGKDDRL